MIVALFTLTLSLAHAAGHRPTWWCVEQLAGAGERAEETGLTETDTQRLRRLVRTRAVRTIKLPFAPSPSLKVRTIPLPARLEGARDVRVELGYFERLQSVIPTVRQVESWHAIIKYFEGFVYLLSFPEPSARAAFVTQTGLAYLNDGTWDQLDADLAHFPVILRPEQYAQLIERGLVRSNELSPERFRRTTRRALAELGATYEVRARSGETYIFDARRQVVGLKQRGSYFLVAPTDLQTRVEAASHLAILKRQNPTVDVSRFTRATPAVETTHDIILAAGDLELDRVERALDEIARKPQENLNRGSVVENQTRLAGLGQLTTWDLVGLTRLITQRLRWAKQVKDEPSELASDLSANLEGLCKNTEARGSTIASRFVWIKVIPDAKEAVFVSRRGVLLHDQMLRLLVGRSVQDNLTTLGVLRGGVLSVEYDERGAAVDVRVLHGRMRGFDATRTTLEVNLSAAERSSLELSILNACREKPRNSKLK